MPRTLGKIEFPFTFERLGRVGKIKHWPSRDIFGTYYRSAGRAVRNSFKTFEAAYEYLDREFARLDAGEQICAVAYPIRSDLREYHELEVLLKERASGEATLREAVDFFLSHSKSHTVTAREVADRTKDFKVAEIRRNVSPR